MKVMFARDSIVSTPTLGPPLSLCIDTIDSEGKIEENNKISPQCCGMFWFYLEAGSSAGTIHIGGLIVKSWIPRFDPAYR